jgi:hypothetical protein
MPVLGAAKLMRPCGELNLNPVFDYGVVLPWRDRALTFNTSCHGCHDHTNLARAGHQLRDLSTAIW